MPQMFDDVGEIVEEALRRVGKSVVLALPLGIGKPNLIANEFFRRARADRGARPHHLHRAVAAQARAARATSRKRFIEPLAARIFGNYPELDYLEAVRRGTHAGQRARHRILLRAGLAAQFPARAVALSLGKLHARGARAAAPRRQRDRARGRAGAWWAAPPKSASAAIPMSPST